MAASERIRHEIREIGLVTLYFFSFFLLFLWLKKLVLGQYDIELQILGTAVVSALVVAKVVVLLGKTSFGSFASGRLALHVFWRSLLYTAVVFIATLAERLFDLYREKDELAAAVVALWSGRDADHFLAMNVCVGLSLLAYNAFAAIDRHLGEGSLRRLFFSPGGAADGRAMTPPPDPPNADAT